MKKFIDNLWAWFCGLFAEKKTSYYYRLSEESNEPEQVPFVQPEPEPAELDVPVFTRSELDEMKKADLLELAVNSGIHGASKKDTKASLIKKISSHYEIEK